jgi:hypothetical protein
MIQAAIRAAIHAEMANGLYCSQDAKAERIAIV